MAVVEIKKKGFECERCEHRWISKNINNEPIVCPKCKSPYWNKPYKRKINSKNKSKVKEK